MRNLRLNRIVKPLFLIFSLLVLPLTAVAQTQRDPAIGATNPEFRGKGSQIPAEMLSWPLITAPSPIGKTLTGVPQAVVSYDITTGQEQIHPIFSEEGKEAISVSEPFEGLAFPGYNPETILGADGRIPVADTTAYPWRTIVKLFITYPNNAQFLGTGMMVGRSDGNGFHVMTAGHIVYSAENGGWATSILCVPGLAGSNAPYGGAYGTNFRSVTNWTVYGDPNYDWGLITLDRTLGNTVGWMGRITLPYTDPVYIGTLNTAGYPYDLSDHNHMYYDSNYGRTTTDTRHWYYMDTAGGQSGSPVWVYYPNTGNRYILTIHTYSDDGSGSNSGTRLNQNKNDILTSWINSDNIPVSPIYRFFNNNAGGHFYTIDPTEKDTVIQDYKWFRYEGVGFNALSSQQPGTLPVYRFFNNNAGGHFYTIDEAEKNTVIQNYKWFRYEGVGFYASTVQQPGTLPVYRFFNNNAGGHFYTINEAEKNTVIQNYKWFRPEGVGFYAYPSQ